MFARINIENALKEEQNAISVFNPILAATEILENDRSVEQSIRNSIQNGNDSFAGIPENGLDTSKIYSLAAIKKVCIRYKLRFLDAESFKGEIPYEAITKAKQISQQSEIELKKFLIMAPARLFKLTDADADPLLFVPTNDGNYYLIHKWGTDLAWYKKITHFPVRSLENLVATILLFALIIALCIPNEWLIPKSFMAVNDIFGYWGFHRVAFFVHITILLCGMTIFYWFAFHKNFSSAEWNKKTFN